MLPSLLTTAKGKNQTVQASDKDTQEFSSHVPHAWGSAPGACHPDLALVGSNPLAQMVTLSGQHLSSGVMVPGAHAPCRGLLEAQ